ncbi:phage tail tube protein [Micromonospora sp. NPDC049044]|uniref:phage tail tube protein n=1 Tax=Micromonospora sp. NPDC049044 TaxID=3154827 RepID=UPI0033D65A84
MAKQVITAAYLALGGTDLSSYTNSIELSVEADEKDVTTFTSGGWKENIPGLRSGTLAIEFKQDVAASALDSIMWANFIGGSAVTFEVRVSNAVVGTSNPKYTGNVLVKEWTPIGGGVGDVAEVKVSFPTSGAVTRATA